MAALAAFRNETELKFEDISSEAWRQYTFPSGDVVKIVEPQKLHVSDTGHRIFDLAGLSHFVPVGWTHLQWKAKDGQPHFVL